MPSHFAGEFTALLILNLLSLSRCLFLDGPGLTTSSSLGSNALTLGLVAGQEGKPYLEKKLG